jgi:HSP20 family protein
MVESPFAEQFRQMLRLLDTARDDAYGDVGAGVFPPLNVTQDNDTFYVRAEIPGVQANKLSISVKRNQLAISGTREIPSEPGRVSHHRKERAEGSFARTVTLPAEVDSERAEARYADGILSLTLPRAEHAKQREIVVKT